MSDRGAELMMQALDQVDEAAQTLEESTDSQLRKPYAENAEGHFATSVGGAAVHFAQGYGKLGKFLHEGGYLDVADRFAPGAGAGGGGGHGHGHGGGHGHGHGHGPGAHGDVTVPEVLKSLEKAREIIALLEELSDAQLDSIPPLLGEWSDGERTLYSVLETIITHQAGHLGSLKAALA